jgi:hypothetical protein
MKVLARSTATKIPVRHNRKRAAAISADLKRYLIALGGK